MALIKEAKVHLSAALEEELFAGVLKKREVIALREQCESYQKAVDEEDKPLWRRDLFRPYSQYFGFLSSLKVKSALEELNHYGYLDVLKDKRIQLIDFGAGTLGATMGAIDFLNENGYSVKNTIAIDQNEEPMEWAAKTFEFLKNHQLDLAGRLPADVSLDNTIVIAVDVFNEMGLMKEKKQINESARYIEMINSWLDRATDSTRFVFIEPAAKAVNQNFIRLRNLLKDKMTILLPCTHQLDCPALPTDDWCHEDRNYKAPSKYWNLVHDMRFQRGLLSNSILCLGKQKSAFEAQQARVVSRKLKGKGRCDKWLCANGKRWKAGLLNRHKSEANEAFFESIRGDIIDCPSTGVKIPD